MQENGKSIYKKTPKLSEKPMEKNWKTIGWNVLVNTKKKKLKKKNQRKKIIQKFKL